jgi:hypothetical protein
MDQSRADRIKQAIADYTVKATRSPEAARAALVREGIYLPSGQLSPEYGGQSPTT